MLIEEMELTDNLMLDGCVHASSDCLVVGKPPANQLFTFLGGFENVSKTHKNCASQRISNRIILIVLLVRKTIKKILRIKFVSGLSYYTVLHFTLPRYQDVACVPVLHRLVLGSYCVDWVWRHLILQSDVPS